MQNVTGSCVWTHNSRFVASDLQNPEKKKSSETIGLHLGRSRSEQPCFTVPKVQRISALSENQDELARGILQRKLDAIDKKLQCLEELSYSTKRIEQKLDLILNPSPAPLSKGFNDLNSELTDRKRLKERLKEASVLKSGQRSKITYTSSLLEYVFGICDADAKVGRERSRAIHPTSRFCVAVTMFSGLLLLYTAIMAPVQVCLVKYDDPCITFPTLHFDVFVDCFFMMEVLLSFLVGYIREDGMYEDRLEQIARRNLSSPLRFWFDAATSTPFSVIDLKFNMDCPNHSPTQSDGTTRIVRAVKILRVLRVFRVLKLVKIVGSIEDIIAIYLGAVVFKLVRLVMGAVLVIHVYACAFWRVKVDYLESSNLDQFLEDRNVPNDDMVQIYVCCFYFVMTVFTTVGFGDITPFNTAERVFSRMLIFFGLEMTRTQQIFCILIFLSSTSVFATLIAQFNEILASSGHLARMLQDNFQAYLDLKPRLDVSILLRIRNWERFNFESLLQEGQMKAVLSKKFLPEKFRLSIAKRVENNLFSKMACLGGMDAIRDIRALFSAEMMLKSETLHFSEGSILADGQEDATGVMVITSGMVGVELSTISDQENIPSRSFRGTRSAGGQPSIYVFTRGDLIGDSAIVGDKRWAGTFGIRADFVALTHCSVVFIKTEDIEGILQKFEFLPIRCRIQMAVENFRRYQLDLQQDPTFWVMSTGREARVKAKSEFFWTLLARKFLLTHYERGSLGPAVRRWRRNSLYNQHGAASASSALGSPRDILGGEPERVEIGEARVELNEAQLAQVQAVFNLFDTDGNGTMDEAELSDAVFALGFASGPVEARALLDKVDRDRSRSMDLNEFKELMRGVWSTSRNAMQEILLTYEYFLNSCTNCQPRPVAIASPPPSNGRRMSSHASTSDVQAKIEAEEEEGIDLERLMAACRLFDVGLTEPEAKTMIHEADRDGDGRVSRSEYVHIMKNTCWF